MAPESPLIAVDTNFLLDLAAGNEACLDSFAALKKVKTTPRFVITPTVLQELAHLASRGASQKTQDLAYAALQSLITWGIKPLGLVPVGHGIVERIGEEIRRKGLLPDEEKHDSEIIAEAALTTCSLLISSDRHLTDMDQKALRELLIHFDVEPTVLMGPVRLLRLFGAK